MKLEYHERLGVLGVTGSGKSSWVAEQIVGPAQDVVVWDYHGEYDARPVTLDEFSELVESGEPVGKVAVVPQVNDLDELSAEFVQFADLLRFSSNHVTVIDECGLLRGKAAARLDYLATQSRHWEQPLVLVAQRATQISRTAREQLSRVVTFRQTSPDDIAALAERIGDRANQVAKLPRFKHVAWSADETFDATAQKRTGKNRSRKHVDGNSYRAGR